MRNSIRVRQQEVARNAILDAACALFLKRGYRETTTTQIAESAGVGVATFFRYFRSKEGVLAAISRRDVYAVLDRAREVLEDPPASPVDGVLELCLRVLEIHNMPSAQINSTRLWLLFPTDHAEIDKVGRESDLEFQKMMRELLKHYRSLGLLDPKLDLTDLVMTIFAVFYQHYIAVDLEKNTTLEAVQTQLRRRIPLLFRSWLRDEHATHRIARSKTRRN